MRRRDIDTLNNAVSGNDPRGLSVVYWAFVLTILFSSLTSLGAGLFLGHMMAMEARCAGR